MGSVIGEALPLALAIAASPFPIIPAILLLFTPRPRAAGGAFLAGWVLGVAGATAVFVALAELIERGDEPARWTSWARIALGLALLVAGWRQWQGRREAGESPSWMRALDDATPRRAMLLGLLLSAANPKILLLAVAAGVTIGAAELGAGGDVVAIAIFAVIASVTVAAPLALYLLRGPRMLAPLGRARGWLEANNAAVMAVVLAAIGLVLLARGVGGL